MTMHAAPQDAPGMTAARSRGAVAIGFALVASAAFYLVPIGLASRLDPALTLAALMAVDAACVALLVRSRGSLAALAALVALAGLTATLRGHLLVALPSMALYAGLSAVFGLTLLPGRMPLITTIALARHGAALGLPARRYLRGLTLAWSLFFAALAVASALLARFAPFDAWSLFVNLLSWPLIGAMFVGDYLLRRLVFREVPADTPLQVIAATLTYRPPAGADRG